MNKNNIKFIVFLFVLMASLWTQGKQEEKEIRGPLAPLNLDVSMMEGETAVLAGGCFWGVEGVFEQLKGVLYVESGYSGGKAETAHYQDIGTGKTGHAESVRVIFDPDLISYETLLDVFFKVAHDPTQLNYQGPDRGTQYRSVIFYTSKEQETTARNIIQMLDKEGLYKEKIVTEISPLDEFFPAEEYHQDFLRLNPTHPYIAYWDIPKIEDLWQKYPELIANK